MPPRANNAAASVRPSRARAAPARLDEEQAWQAQVAKVMAATKPRVQKRARTHSTAAAAGESDAASANEDETDARANASAEADDAEDDNAEYDDNASASHSVSESEQSDSESAAPKKKKRKIAASTASSASNGKVPKAAAKQSKKSEASTSSDVALPAYTRGPVFDSCNEVRNKIRALLRKGDTTIAAFLRDCGGVNSNSYRQFMQMKGPLQGGGNCLYPAAYHYFEQRRLAAGKPKSKTRLESEAAFPNGYQLRSITRVWCFGDDTPTIDRIGRLHMQPRRPPIDLDFLRQFG